MEKKKQNSKKFPFAVIRKGAVGLAIAGMMAFTPFMAGCSGTPGEPGKDGKNGAMWYTGLDVTQFENTGVVGDFFLDTDDCDIYQKTASGWAKITNIKGDDAETPEITINQDGYWVIGETTTTVLATGEDGETPYIKDGKWWIGEYNTTIDATGANGKSAFDLYKEANPSFTGTIQDWLDSLKGTHGTSSYTYIKYADIMPDDNSDMKDTASDYMGIYVGTSETAPTDYTAYTWFKIKGEDGAHGTNGASWITGFGAPDVSNGENGDTYLDISTNDVYVKSNGAWSKIGELTGDRDITIQEQSSPWYGKRAVFVGDSITYGSGCDGDKYWQVLEDELGFAQVTGMGVGGSCFSTKSDYGTANSPLINRYNSIPEADLIQIFMGTNDYGHGTPLGSIEDTTDVSFYGALNVILPALQKKYPSSRIVVVTPLHRYGRNASDNVLTYDYLPHPVTQKTLADYVDAMKEVCQRYSIPVIDLFNISGINPTIEEVRNMYMPDGLHPNTEGHKLIANIMKYHLNLYATSEEQVVVKPNYDYGLVVGNKFSTDTDTQNNSKRATLSKNIYLESGTVVNVINDSVYTMAVYGQNGETLVGGSNISGGFVTTYTINESGYYGFVLAQDGDFDFNTMSSNFYNYVNIVEPIIEGKLVTGNLFGTNTSSDKTRVTVEKNIYIEEPMTITIKNSSDYALAVYNQSGEDIVNSSSISGYVEEFTIVSPGWYGFVIKNNNSVEFNFNTDNNSFYDYVNIVELTTGMELSMKSGNQYDSNYVSNNTRASVTKNIYLKAGTTISLKDTNYLYGVFPQTSENITFASAVQVWTAEDYIITADGWYGFVTLHSDKTTEFDFSVDSDNIYDYITINKPSEVEHSILEGISLVAGNKYDSSYLTNTTRASINKNIYLKAGTVISLADSNYLFGVFQQTSETLEVNKCLQVWTTEDFTIQTDGWYGIAFAHDDKTTSFDFNTDSENASSYITITESN